MKDKFLNILIGGEQKHQSIKTDGICTCLCSSMGTGGGYVPLIVFCKQVKNNDRNNKYKNGRKKS